MVILGIDPGIAIVGYGIIEYKNNKIISTKGSNHGYGISNIDKIVKKYNGTYKIDCVNNEFKSSILIHLCN